MLDIHILGSAATVPTAKRSLPCILLKWKGEPILFDAGECCQRQMMKAKVHYGRIRKAFISHLHIDHFLGLIGLLETLNLLVEFDEGEKFNIYAPKGFSRFFINPKPFTQLEEITKPTKWDFADYTIEAFTVKHWDNAYGFIFEQKPYRKLYKDKIKGLNKDEIIELVKKGKVGNTRLEDVSYIQRGIKVVYTGDTAYFDGLKEKMEGADVVIADSTFDESLEEEAHYRQHMTVKEISQAAQESNVKMLILTHISARYPESDLLEEQAKKHFKGKIYVAEDLLKVTIDKPLNL